MPVISSKIYFDACLKAHIVALDQTRHLRLFSGSVCKNWRFYSARSEKCTVPLLLNEGSFSKASAPPLFLEDENIFQKSATTPTLVPRGIEFPTVPWRPIFEKSSHLREKWGVLMLFKTTLHL
jgi:hypothetical protein